MNGAETQTHVCRTHHRASRWSARTPSSVSSGVHHRPWSRQRRVAGHRRSGSTSLNSTVIRCTTTSSPPDGRATNIDSVGRPSMSLALLRDGPNCLGITVGEGWYRGRLGFGGGVREVYGSDIAAIARLVLTYPDRVVTVETDADWRASLRTRTVGGPVRRRALRRSTQHTRMVVAWLRRRFVEFGRSNSPRLATVSSPMTHRRSAASRNFPSSKYSRHRRDGPSATSGRTSPDVSVSQSMEQRAPRSPFATPKCSSTPNSVPAR